ncbi:MAG: hypothetical protein LJE87_17390 [Deltaproteobacteria bacterium]|nr:hypothetical protein [Deltaproteobacteria bacterium]
MAVLPGVLGCRPLRCTVQVRLGTNPAVPRDELPGGTSIFAVSRQQLKIPSARCRESSKCKVFIPFYCSSLANPRLARKAGLRVCARWSIFVKYPG